jgi:hypothetical protein
MRPTILREAADFQKFAQCNVRQRSGRDFLRDETKISGPRIPPRIIPLNKSWAEVSFDGLWRGQPLLYC